MAKIFVCKDFKILEEQIINFINSFDETISLSTLKENTRPDVHVLHPINESIGISEIKELISKLSFKPMISSMQFGIILQSELLTLEAQNALLKTLEEHSELTEYVLGVSALELLLPTIISRCKVTYVSCSIPNIVISEEANKFLESQSCDKFLWVQNFVKLKPNRMQVLDFINQLIILCRNKILRNENNKTDLLENVNVLNKCYKNIKNNANISIVLEYLALKLN